MAPTSRPSLGKRPSSALFSSPPSSPVPVSSNKRQKTCASTTITLEGPNANKENIPPPADLIERLGSPRSLRSRSRRESTSRRARSPEPATSELTPPQTPQHEDEAMDLTTTERIPAPNFSSIRTPSRAMSSLTLATPPTTPYASLHARARALLRTTSDVSCLIGREAERGVVLDFINSFIDSPSSKSTSLYISGSPGTGKTALVSSALASIQHEGLRSVYVNCMGLKDINVLWERVINAIGGSEAGSSKTRASTSPSNRLEKMFASGGFKCILVLDELDTFGSAALSNIFALPTKYSSSLRVIAISNDLAQNTANPALSVHRPSLSLPFAAYTAVEMQTIIRARLAQVQTSEASDEAVAATLAQIIQPSALTFLVKKVSAQTGDIRFALEVLRRALDLASAPSDVLANPVTVPTPVGMKHVLDALKRVATNTKATVAGGVVSGPGPLHGCISSLGLQARLVLVSVLVARRRSSHGLSMEDIALPSFVSASPSKSSPTKAKVRRSISFMTSTSISPSKIYSLYTTILNACPSKPYEPVSRSEYTDLLGVLETASLISMPAPAPTPTTPSKVRRSKSLGNMGAINASSGDVSLCVNEDEVLRALSNGTGVREQEIARIWEREVQRVERSLQRLGELAAEGNALSPEDYL